MNPVNLDEKTQNWHADATLPPSLRARLSQAAPSPQRRSPTPALRYGLAACIGVGLGLGFVAYKNLPHQTQTQTLSQATQSDKSVSNEDFQKVANTIKFWREPDEKAVKKTQRYEAILFTDLDCPSCAEAYNTVKKASWLRLGVCQMPLTEIHPHALRKAIEAEEYQNPVVFWTFMDRAHGEWSQHAWQVPQVPYNGLDKPAPQTAAERRVASMRAAALSAGVTETPTLWVREEGASIQPMMLRSYGGIAGIKIILETLQ